MGTNNDSAEDKNRQILVDQFAFFAEELSTQKNIIARIPAPILNAAPFDGMQSIRDRYDALFTREVLNSELFSSALGLDPTSFENDFGSSSVEVDIRELLKGIANIRTQVANQLRALDERDWSAILKLEGQSVTLSAWIYQIVLQDADDLLF